MVSWRTSWWYIKAFVDKYRQPLILGIVLGILLVWVFPRLIVLIPQQKETTFVGRVGLFSWVDLPQDIQERVSAGLTSLDTSGQPISTLVDRWSVEDDGRVFRFLLKQDLRWQDGKPFRAEDVQYNFADVQIVRTENEVVFRLEDAYAPFPAVVSQPLFRQVQERKFGWLKQTRIIGLGEYRLTNLHYNGPYIRELTIENASERLVYRFYATERDAVMALRHGRIDRLENLQTLQDFLPLEREQYLIDEQINPYQYVALYFNTTNPNLAREVRQALHYATRKPGPEDERLRALSPLSPTSWAYNETNEVNPFSYDLEEAITLWVSAQPVAPMTLTIDSAVTLLEDAQAIAQDWKALGEETRLRCERGELGTTEANAGDCNRYRIEVETRVVRDMQNFDAVLVGREVPPDPDQYTWWHSNQAQNISHYQNPRVDKLLEDARKETDQQRRKLLYFEFQRYLVEDVPAMFLYYLPDYTVERANWL